MRILNTFISNSAHPCVMLSCDRQGSVSFQNNAGISSDSFLELLDTYFKSSFAVHEEWMYTHKQGTSIGSAVAPLLSNLYVAKLDRDIQKRMKDEVLAIFRYVDDYLVFHRINDNDREARVTEEEFSHWRTGRGTGVYSGTSKWTKNRVSRYKIFLYDGTYILGPWAENQERYSSF